MRQPPVRHKNVKHGRNPTQQLHGFMVLLCALTKCSLNARYIGLIAQSMSQSKLITPVSNINIQKYPFFRLQG